MVGAMTLKLAQDASLEEMVRFGVAAGSAATLNQGTRLCSHDDTQKYTPIFPRNNRFPLAEGIPKNRLTGGASAAVKNTVAPNEVNDGQWRYYPLCYYRNLP